MDLLKVKNYHDVNCLRGYAVLLLKHILEQPQGEDNINK